MTKAEVSLCTISNEQATLHVYADPQSVQQFAASPDGHSGIVALGANWTIAVQTPGEAAKLAAALGGTAPGPAGGTGTPGTTGTPAAPTS